MHGLDESSAKYVYKFFSVKFKEGLHRSNYFRLGG